jgi:hypothetical protein
LTAYSSSSRAQGRDMSRVQHQQHSL